jgi:LCP family protein required for cell wall assembly
MSDWNRNGETQAHRVITGHVIAQPEQTRPYEQPVPRPQAVRPGGGHTRSTRPAWVRPSRRRRIARLLALLVCALILTGGGTYAWADFELDRAVDLGTVGDRPPPGKGTTYLIVGSDSRDGLSEQARKDLHAGGGGGSRTDSMMLLHTGAHGTTMVSLPRDSWVTLPSYLDPDTGKRHRPAKDKLNAAYSLGGARLLVRTIELNTGIRVDHYAEIGFGGFAKIVDAVGGVEMNIPQDIKDKNSGADFKKGKQILDGKEALSFVRNRHAGTGDSDLGRTKNQQKFLAALANQTATPGTVLNPFRLYPTMGAGLDTLVVDKDMSLWQLGSMFFAMKDVNSGEGKRMNMPISGPAPAGSLQWDKAKVKQLVEQLKNDEKVTVTSDR